MKAESKGSDVAILLTLLLLVGVVFFLVYSGKTFKAYHDNQASLRTTHSINIDGTLLWFTLLERLHHDVVRWEEPLLASRLQPVGVLCILDPKIPLHNLELHDLKEWVETGGVLLCKAETDLALQELHPFARLQGPRSDSPSAMEEMPLGHVRSVRFLQEGNLSFPPDAEPTILYRDHAGIRIAEKTVGRGRVIVLAEDSFLTNGRIETDDNSVLAIHLMEYALSHARTKAIAFDEYHFGYGDSLSDWELLLVLLCTTKPGGALLCLLAAGILYLLYRGQRFGTPLALTRTTRGSEMEYIIAVGEMYRRRALNRRILQELFQHLKHKLCKRYSLSPSAPLSTLASAMQSGAPDSNLNLEAVFQDVEAAIESPSLSASHMTDLLRRLGAVEKEWLDEHP